MRVLDALHRWSGGIIGLLLALLGLSGALLVHKDAWVFLPHVDDAQVQTTDAIATVADRLMADPARRPWSVTFASETFGLDRIAYPGGEGAYVTQAGAPVASWDSQWERPELWLADFHQHLFSGKTGETVVGIAGLFGLFFIVSGTFLWWRTRRTFDFRILPARLTRPSILRHHRDLGIVVAPLLAMTLVTGVMMVFRPLTSAVLGPGAAAEVVMALKSPGVANAKLGQRLDWGGMIRTARARFPDAELRSLSVPRGDSGVITLRMRRPEEWLPNGRTTVWFAADTGRLIAARDARDLSPRVTAYNAFFPLHAGKVGGLAYRLIATVSGLALSLLGSLAVWSFWFRRSPRGRPGKPTGAAAQGYAMR